LKIFSKIISPNSKKIRKITREMNEARMKTAKNCGWVRSCITGRRYKNRAKGLSITRNPRITESMSIFTENLYYTKK
jgi:hypothetical protein